jgi:tetratricopeptide (TPR) repeat protein
MNLIDVLEELEYEDIIRRVPSADGEFSFKHTLTQETACQSLLLRSRRGIHRAVAQAYEELYPERLDEFAALLAEHYAQAEDDAKTLEYATRAGDAAARVYANAEAIAHYSQALEIVKREPRPSSQAGLSPDNENVLLDLYLKRGRAFELSGHYDRALRNYEEMKVLALERQNKRLELEALMASATLYSIPGSANSPLQARALSTQALALAQELGYRAAQAKIYWNLMLLENWGGGDSQRAVELGEKSLALAREFGLRGQRAYTLHDLAMAYALAGQVDRAGSSQNEALGLWREFQNMPMYAEGLNRTATIHFSTGDLQGVISSALEAQQLARRIGNIVGEGLASYILSHAYWEQGQADLAIQQGDNGMRFAQESPVGPLMALSIQSQMAWIYGSLGMVDKGIEIARSGLEHVTHLLLGEDEFRRHHLESVFKAALIGLELETGNLAAARALFAQARFDMNEYAFVVRSLDAFPIFQVVTDLKLAEADYDAAGKTLDQLMAALKRFPVRPYLVQTMFLRGKWLAAQGLDQRAVETWQIARAEAEAMNLRPALWQILVALAAACDRLGRHAEPAELLGQARAIVQYIADHSPADLRASFLGLPQVQPVLDGVAFAESKGREEHYESR